MHQQLDGDGVQESAALGLHRNAAQLTTEQKAADQRRLGI